MNGNDVQRNNTKYRNNHYYFEKQHKQILSVQGKHMIQSLYTCFCPFEYVANRRHDDEKKEIDNRRKKKYRDRTTSIFIEILTQT